jgi:hypothetical protein
VWLVVERPGRDNSKKRPKAAKDPPEAAKDPPKAAKDRAETPEPEAAERPPGRDRAESRFVRDN